MKPVSASSKTGKDIVAWCLSAKNGAILWQREIEGIYQTKLSAPFGDASSPSAVTDGTHVWFLNPTGKLACFDFEGNTVWTKRVTSVSRSQPVLHDGMLILHSQVYHPDSAGHFTHEHKDAPHELWTQLQALDAATGGLRWLSQCGVNMGAVPIIQQLADGTDVLVVGRGGGHGPPEKPEGVSMIRAKDGTTAWTLPLPGFMSTQTFPIVNGHALIFHKSDHLWVDVTSGKVTRQVSLVKDVRVRRWTDSGYETRTETLQEKARPVTQQSNLLVGKYHFFRTYTRNYLGRIDTTTGNVEYLELPLQVLREPGEAEQVLWNADQRPDDLAATTEKRFRKNLSYTSLRHNRVENARGLEVMGDTRAIGNGWGHTASPIPTAFGNRLYIPILCGMVFVIDANAEQFDEGGIVAINDLGELGEAFTRASITTNGRRIFARTIREVIAIE